MENLSQNGLQPGNPQGVATPTPQQSPQPSKSKVIIGTVVLIVLLLLSGYYLLLKGKWTKSTSVSESNAGNWETYQNVKFGFEFKYPQDWSNLYPDGYGSIHEFTTFFQKDISIPNIQFSVVDVSKIKPDINGKSSCVENEMGCPSYSIVKNYSVGGNKARIVNYGGGGGAQVFVDVFHKGLVYEFLAFGRDSSLIENMAETLRFTD